MGTHNLVACWGIGLSEKKKKANLNGLQYEYNLLLSPNNFILSFFNLFFNFIYINIT